MHANVGHLVSLDFFIFYNSHIQWLATGRWFSPDTPVSSTNKTDHHDITEILLKVALSNIKQPNHQHEIVYISCRLYISVIYCVISSSTFFNIGVWNFTVPVCVHVCWNWTPKIIKNSSILPPMNNMNNYLSPQII